MTKNPLKEIYKVWMNSLKRQWRAWIIVDLQTGFTQLLRDEESAYSALKVAEENKSLQHPLKKCEN